MCRCSVLLKSVHSFDSDGTSSFSESRGDSDGSGGKSIPVASIHKCVGGAACEAYSEDLKAGGALRF